MLDRDVLARFGDPDAPCLIEELQEIHDVLVRDVLEFERYLIDTDIPGVRQKTHTRDTDLPQGVSEAELVDDVHLDVIDQGLQRDLAADALRARHLGYASKHRDDLGYVRLRLREFGLGFAGPGFLEPGSIISASDLLTDGFHSHDVLRGRRGTDACQFLQRRDESRHGVPPFGLSRLGRELFPILRGDDAFVLDELYGLAQRFDAVQGGRPCIAEKSVNPPDTYERYQGD